MTDKIGAGSHGPTSERIMRHYYGAAKGGEMEQKSVASKIEALKTSTLPDEQKLQVLICLVAELANLKEAVSDGDTE